MGSVIHDSYGFIVVEIVRFLGGGWVVIVGWLVVLRVVIFLANISFWPIVCFLIAPGKRKVGIASWCMYYPFIGFSVKICVVRNVFIEHVLIKLRD